MLSRWQDVDSPESSTVKSCRRSISKIQIRGDFQVFLKVRAHINHIDTKYTKILDDLFWDGFQGLLVTDPTIGDKRVTCGTHVLEKMKDVADPKPSRRRNLYRGIKNNWIRWGWAFPVGSFPVTPWWLDKASCLFFFGCWTFFWKVLDSNETEDGSNYCFFWDKRWIDGWR